MPGEGVTAKTEAANVTVGEKVQRANCKRSQVDLGRVWCPLRRQRSRRTSVRPRGERGRGGGAGGCGTELRNQLATVRCTLSPHEQSAVGGRACGRQEKAPRAGWQAAGGALVGLPCLQCEQPICTPPPSSKGRGGGGSPPTRVPPTASTRRGRPCAASPPGRPPPLPRATRHRRAHLGRIDGGHPLQGGWGGGGEGGATGQPAVGPFEAAADSRQGGGRGRRAGGPLGRMTPRPARARTLAGEGGGRGRARGEPFDTRLRRSRHPPRGRGVCAEPSHYRWGQAK